MSNTTVSGWILALALSVFAAACGGDSDPSGPDDEAPVISVTGVEDGDTRSGPVTIDIDVDRGSFEATLNDEPFFSGQTVEKPGAYLLRVDARNGSATSSLEIAFEIVLSGETRLIVRMFDLGANDAGGGGDAILLSDSSSAGITHALVDAGPAGVGGSDRSFVSRRLTALGVDTLEILLLTHAHSDHFDGIPDVVDRAFVKLFFHNGQVRSFSRYNSTISQATTAAGNTVVPDRVFNLELGVGDEPTRLAVLPPLRTFLDQSDADGSEINEGSIGTEVRKGGFRMFLTGDGEVRANQRWRIDFGQLTGGVDVLKVGHHGANDAVFDNGFNGSSTWLGHAAPAVNIISANGESHPRVNATNFLLGIPQTRTYCTSVHGDIEIRVGESGDFDVDVERNANTDCEPGSEAGS